MKLNRIIPAAVLAASLLIGCSSGARHSFDGIPEGVTLAAEDYVKVMYENHRTSDTTNTAVDWRIDEIRLVHNYPDLEGHDLDVYVFNYKYKTDMPEMLMLAGGMYLAEDGWYCPDYDNSHYLVFEDGEYVCTAGANDCAPGAEPFDSELRDRPVELGKITDRHE